MHASLIEGRMHMVAKPPPSDETSEALEGAPPSGHPAPVAGAISQSASTPSSSFETVASTEATDRARKTQGVAEPPPHFHGHRKRLRARFLETNGAGFADYELLELLLFGALPRGDVKPLAKSLIERYGNFAGVLNASAPDLETVAGLGSAGVSSLKVARVAAERLARQQVIDRPVISSWVQLLDYCRIAMAHEPVEQFRILFLDRRNALIGDEIQQQGTVDHAPVYPREVVRRALEVHASAVIFVHNHPSGDSTPSTADIQMTKRLVSALAAVEVSVHDHLIIGRNDHSSFKSLGLL
ncbi:MAG: DNA repair protein RadC [Pseudomonadota bacterium]